MLVTIFSDGSYDFHRKAGGWAVWLESEKGCLVHYGSCPEFVSCSNHAELFAIHMGVTLAYREWGDAIHSFLIRADSECALRHVTKGPVQTRVRDREMLKIRSWLLDVFRKCGVQVLTEHVKGHQSPSLGYAFAMNNKVDKMAAKGRKSMTGQGFIRAHEALEISSE